MPVINYNDQPLYIKTADNVASPPFSQTFYNNNTSNQKDYNLYHY